MKIPLRDKVELNATLYLPKTPEDSAPRTPVIFTLTPYVSDTYHPRAAYFASHVYTFALVGFIGISALLTGICYKGFGGLIVLPFVERLFALFEPWPCRALTGGCSVNAARSRCSTMADGGAGSDARSIDSSPEALTRH